MSGTIRYTIRPYDTLWMLAQVFNTTVDSIMQLNPGIDPRNLQVGQVITIMPGYQYYPPYMGEVPLPGEASEMPSPEETGELMMPGTTGGTMPGTTGGMMPGTTGGTMPGTTGGTMPGVTGGVDYEDYDMDDDMMELDILQCELVNYFRMLWEQHITWTRMAIVAIINNLPDKDLILQRLLRNPVDFANALRTFYGDKAAQTFEELLTEHLTIAAELVQAAKAGNTNAAAEAEQRWFENASQIAEFLGTLNPYWSVEDWNAMMNEHLELLKDNVTDLLARNYQESINGYDDIEAQALEMADMMAEGIARQFPINEAM